MRKIKFINRKGQVIILVTLAVVLLLLLVGLALDSGIGYAVKAKLNSAVDAAAIAAGRAGSGGDTVAAEAAASTFFHANFPAGYLRAEVSEPTVDISVNPDTGEWTISVSATAVVPTYFLRIRGNNTFTANATAVAVKRDLDMAFVLDTTGSLSSVFREVQRASVRFIDKFDETSDRVALIHFAFGAVVDDSIRTSSRGFTRTSVVNHINNFSASGNTNYSEAFWRGRDQLDSIPVGSRSGVRAIVFFSDGSPNSFSSTFNAPSCSATSRTGVIVTGDSPGSPTGLTRIGSVGGASSGCSASSVTSMPAFFNLGTGIGDNTFHVTSPTSDLALGLNPRPVTSTVNFVNVNNAARNLAEEMASNARAAGIHIYTIGLGNLLTANKTWGNNERGDTVLRNMANDPSAPNHTSDQPEGLYCHAAYTSGDPTDPLNACFDKVANQLFRLTR
jgi:Flp pilus assembly protein TadG